MRRAAYALFAILVITGFFAFRSARAVQPRVPELGILRTEPLADEYADPQAPVTVTFDRPVAGGLEDMVDAERVFRISPSAAGKVEWRDPVTIRFTPDRPLEAGREYTVTIGSNFSAMDGGKLPKPHRFSFRVARARVLTGDPVGPNNEPRFLPPQPRFRVLVSNETDGGVLAAAGRVEFGDTCSAARPYTPVPLRQVEQRRIGKEDPEWFRYYGVNGNDSTKDLRRVVELTPARPLPSGCKAVLVLPARLDSVRGEQVRWPFRTYGPFRVLHAGCPQNGGCHYGPAEVVFSTPVRGADVLRHVHLAGRTFTVRDTAEASDYWLLEGRLEPRHAYTMTVDAELRDQFEQRLPGPVAQPFTTPGVPPSIVYPHGKMIVEREGFGTLAVQHVNVDTLLVTAVPVPEGMEAEFLGGGWSWMDPFKRLEPSATVRKVAVRNVQDRSAITGVKLPMGDASGGGGTLWAVRVNGRGVDTVNTGGQPIALVQVTDLAVHARVGVDQAVVWVTAVHDGQARNGVDVELHDDSGTVVARGRTDVRGIAVLSGFGNAPPVNEEGCTGYCGGGSGFDGYVSARSGTDRAVVGVTPYDPDLSPYEFGVYSAYGEERAPAAGAVFTERGIYRPGEPVYAKAVVRRGSLGALAPPQRGDSLRWVFTDREGRTLRDTVVALSRFGTADQTFPLGADLPLGEYGVAIQARRDGRWRQLGYASYQVAEYRPPEFLVDATAPKEPRTAGEEVRVTVGGRYLFGAPMAHAPLRWSARQDEVSPWELQIPGTDGYQLGEEPDWWSDEGQYPSSQELGSGIDTLDDRGYRDLVVKAAAQAKGRPARLTVEAEVVDANRQTVGTGASVLVHPADFYIGAKPQVKGWFLTAGTPVRVDVIAIRPDGRGVPGVAVSGTVARREWHRVRRMRNGVYEDVGEWVTDTVATCRVTTAAAPAPCAFTPREGGDYTVTLVARDGRGREVRTKFTRWVVGPGWVPWNDEGKFRMEVVPDRERYAVGDTATVLLAAPFTNAEAWVTVERERVMRQYRIRITSGTQTVKIPVTEEFAPNAYVSVVMVRGRSARPGTVDDPGRPTLRVGYAELKVTPEVKRLKVEVQPLRPEFRPGDTARVRLRLRDAWGRPQQGEVTVWAVDEGVLSLTKYETPDPIALIYQPRGLGMRLASNLVSVAPQVPEGQKGARNPGGDGGDGRVGVLRSVFRPTAFFIGSVTTNANGEAVVAGALPDNITTFRVMALAVTAGDRYGSGQSPLLSTRPLLARPALPRFLREGDDFTAGVVVNHRFGHPITAQVDAQAWGVSLRGDTRQSYSLAAGRGAEARFHFRAIPGDSARFRFHASGAGEADAVEVRLPIRPANRPVTQAVSGLLRDTATVEWLLAPEADLARSRLELGFGTSPLALVQGWQRWLDVYPYECSEQISSGGLPLVTLYRAQRASGVRLLRGEPGPRIERVIALLSSRQREDGGIGLWSAADWSSPWLTAYAGRVLLDAREAGFTVSDSVMSGIAGYLTRALHDPDAVGLALGLPRVTVEETLTERLAAVDLLSRMGQPDVPSENVLLGQAARMAWEDRVLLAEVLARRGAREPALRLLDAAWAGVKVRGTRAYLPPGAYRHGFYFTSAVRPAGRLLTATLALRPNHPMLGALVETLVQQGRAEAEYEWTTQDYGAAVLALFRFEQMQTRAGARDRIVRVRQGGRVVTEQRARPGQTPAHTALTGLVTRRWDGRKVLRVNLQGVGAGPAVYYQLTVREVDARTTYTPLDRGISVERWYETVDTHRPVTTVVEGQVVRVRLRITLPEDRSMVVLDDPLPAGLEAVDLSLRTVSPFAADLLATEDNSEEHKDEDRGWWSWGSWDGGMWSPFDHSEIRDDRVVYFARRLWRGSYNATYLARATTAGRFISGPAHAEEMYNPGVHGRSGGGLFVVRAAGR